MILVTVSVAHAQEGHCDVTQARTVEHLDGVVVHELTLTGAWGANKARALLPDERSVESDIVFPTLSFIRKTALQPTCFRSH
jgi:hypothetical protein